MSLSNVITPTMAEHVMTLHQWLREYICEPHPQLGRKGAICPFVVSALRRDAILLKLEYGIDGSSVEEIEHIVRQHEESFRQYHSFQESLRQPKALLVVFPDIPDDKTTVLDTVHARTKTEFVGKGLVPGQFHMHCPEPAARNPFFRISLSPLPFYALRYISLHDILFLSQREEWFAEYYACFGYKYEQGQVSNEHHFVDLFEESKRRFPGAVNYKRPPQRDKEGVMSSIDYEGAALSTEKKDNTIALLNKWYQVHKDNPDTINGEEIEDLLDAVRNKGVYKLQSTQLSTACSSILKEASENLSPPLCWMLKRLQNAGLSPPYSTYIGLEALINQEQSKQSSPEIAKSVFRSIYDLLSHLLEIQILQDHPRRKILENRVGRILDKCREYTFSLCPPEPTPSYSIRCSLLPESGVLDELVFLRVLQCTDLSFNAAAFLGTRAIELMAYGNMVETLVALHWITCLEALLVPLLRPLATMDISCWLEIRPLIELPSAIQSMNFHHLSTQLEEMQRLLDHPRIPQEQLRYRSCCQELINLAHSLLQKWYNAHFCIAAKYGQASDTFKPKGVQWLEGQQLLLE